MDDARGVGRRSGLEVRGDAGKVGKVPDGLGGGGGDGLGLGGGDGGERFNLPRVEGAGATEGAEVVAAGEGDGGTVEFGEGCDGGFPPGGGERVCQCME